MACGSKVAAWAEALRTIGSARLTLRRALDLVAKSERIVRHAGRGCYISGEFDGAAMALGGGVALLRDLARASPADLMELRLIIEPAAASLSAIRQRVKGSPKIL